MENNLGIRFLVECRNHLFPFIGVKIDINTLEGYPEKGEDVSLNGEQELNIYLLLGNLRISGKGIFLGKYSF